MTIISTNGIIPGNTGTVAITVNSPPSGLNPTTNSLARYRFFKMVIPSPLFTYLSFTNYHLSKKTTYPWISNIWISGKNGYKIKWICRLFLTMFLFLHSIIPVYTVSANQNGIVNNGNQGRVWIFTKCLKNWF